MCGIYIENDQLLLIKHKGIGKLGELWLPPGGGIEFGEDAESGLIREFLEETGLEIAVNRFLFLNEYRDDHLHAVELFFEVSKIGGELTKGHDPEMNVEDQIIEELKFVTFEDLAMIERARKHNILAEITSKNELLNMEGYFKFCQ